MEDRHQIDELVVPLVNSASTQPSNRVVSTNSNPLHDPYYLHPSAELGNVLVNTPLTRGNYHLWARAMKVALKSKNKLKFVDGTIKKPDE